MTLSGIQPKEKDSASQLYANKHMHCLALSRSCLSNDCESTGKWPFHLPAACLDADKKCGPTLIIQTNRRKVSINFLSSFSGVTHSQRRKVHKNIIGFWNVPAVEDNKKYQYFNCNCNCITLIYTFYQRVADVTSENAEFAPEIVMPELIIWGSIISIFLKSY